MAAFLCLVIMTLPSCVVHADKRLRAADVTGSEIGNNPLEVQGLVMQMADRYAAALGEVVYLDLQAESLDPTGRWLAISFLRNGMGAVLDIGASANPWVGLLDMLVLSSLQAWAFENQWLRTSGFGAAGERAAERLRSAKQELWQQGSSVLTEDQLDELATLIEDWKEAHPDATVVSLIRFVEFSKARRLSIKSRESASGLLASVRDAGAAIQDVELLGERVLWFAGRYPYLLGQQTELTAYRMAAHPEAELVRNSLVALNERFATLDADLLAQQEELFRRLGSERASAVQHLFEGLAAERSAIFDELEQRQEDIVPMMRELLEVIRASETLTTDITATINALDGIVARFDRDPDDTSEPLKISELTEAAAEIAAAAEKLTLLLDRASVTLDSPNLDARLDRFDRLAAGMVDRAFWRLLILIGVIFVGLALLRLIRPRAH